MKNKILLFISLFFILASCQEKKENQIRVMCNLPMTGYVGVYGDWLKSGINMSLQQNEKKLIDNGLDIDVIFDDNRGENKDAITILKKQMLDEPDIIISGLTGQSMAIADQVTASKIPHFLFSFTPLILEEGKYQFRAFANFGVEVEHYINFIKQKKVNKVALIYLDIVGATQQANEVIIPFLKKDYSNVEILNEQYPVSLMDFKSIANKVKALNPDAIIVNGFAGNLISLIKTFHQNQIDMSKMMCSMDLLDTTNDLSKELLDGISVTAPAFVISTKQTENMRLWKEAYMKKHQGQNPAYTEAYAFDMMNIICEASINVKKMSKDMTSSLLEINMEGVTGPLKFAQNGELYPNMYTVKFKDGELIE